VRRGPYTKVSVCVVPWLYFHTSTSWVTGKILLFTAWNWPLLRIQTQNLSETINNFRFCSIQRCEVTIIWYWINFHKTIIQTLPNTHTHTHTHTHAHTHTQYIYIYTCVCVCVCEIDRWWRRRKQLLNDLKENRGYWKLKKETLDRTLWTTRFGGDYGPAVRQTARWVYIEFWLAENRLVPDVCVCVCVCVYIYIYRQSLTHTRVYFHIIL